MSTVAALLLMLLPLAPAGEQVALEVRLSAAQVRVGDPIEVTIAARALGANSIRIEPLPGSDEPASEDQAETPQPDLLVRESKAHEGLDFLGARIAMRTYRAIPFAVGEHAIPITPIKVVMPDGSERVLTTPAIALDVISVSAEEGGPDQLAGLKDLLRRGLTGNETPIWVWVLLALILFVLGTAAVIALNKRQPRRLRKLVELSPAERALRQLDKLAASGILEEGHVKEYYTELSEIVRRYLGLRFRVLALEMTTPELDSALAEPLAMFAGTRERLAPILQTADLVKFARLIPEEETSFDRMDAAREVVIATRDDIRAPAQEEAA